jgi:hypothetical protein
MCERDGYNEIHEFCRDLTLCSRGHALYHDSQRFHVYCFKERADAQKFMERFGGEKFYSIEPRCQLGEVEKSLNTRFAVCGHEGANIQHSGWAGKHIGFMPFPIAERDHFSK